MFSNFSFDELIKEEKEKNLLAESPEIFQHYERRVRLSKASSHACSARKCFFSKVAEVRANL